MDQKILLIGPYLDFENPKRIGGATILFKHLLDHLDNNKVEYTLIHLDKKEGFSALLRNLFHLFAKTWRHSKGANAIMINVNQRGALYIAPLLYSIS